MNANLTFEEFTDAVVKEILGYLPEEYKGSEITSKKIDKNNETLTGLIIRKEDSNVTPTIYLESFYKQYQSGINPENILKAIADMRNAHDNDIDTPDLKFLTDYESSKEKIIFKLINRENNARYLADKPHRVIADLALIYAVEVDCHKNSDMNASCVITYNILEHWNITEDMLYEIAINNLQKNNPVDFIGMGELLGVEGDSSGMYVLTTKNRLNGSVLVLLKEEMKKIKEKIGNFVMLPSSVHEWILIANVDINNELELEQMTTMISEVNRTLEPSIVLSNHIYVYDDEEILKIVK